jgi:endonuclease/exonuclease/phosphatase family metal-dependent hydrolase
MRVSAYNVENLFSRPVVLNMKDNDKAAVILAKIAEFTKLMDLDSYAGKKKRIEELYEEIGRFIEINIRSSKIGRFVITENQGLIAKGRGDWDGFIDLKRERFSEEQIRFTGKVIKTVKADLQCFVEVESADTLKRFNTDILGSMFSDRLVVDGNDPRGIDVGFATKKALPILTAKTNVFARDSIGTIFSRDCLEAEVAVSAQKRIHVLVNHFKAKDRTPVESNKKRKRQSTEVSRILTERYDLKKDFVVVAGDLNDEPDSDPIAPLVATPNLLNVWDVVGRPEDDRWTYYYGASKQYNKIDYLFVSKALKDRVKDAGIERRGIFDLEKLTDGAEKSFPGITNWKLAASDHAAVWVDLDI